MSPYITDTPTESRCQVEGNSSMIKVNVNSYLNVQMLTFLFFSLL